MTKIGKMSLIGLLLVLLSAQGVAAHCEIPCGIYGDEMRVQMILEDVETIEKSMQQINLIQKDDKPNFNQLVRWVTNKETHAGKIQEIVCQYFLTQRIKPGMERYDQLLSKLHAVLLLSMKCKQTTDLENVSKLRDEVKLFEKIYFNHK